MENKTTMKLSLFLCFIFLDCLSMNKQSCDTVSSINQCDSRGRNALHHSIINRDFEAVKILVNANADVNFSSEKQETPFELAESLYILMPEDEKFIMIYKFLLDCVTIEEDKENLSV